jgi:cold shock CspA family protein
MPSGDGCALGEASHQIDGPWERATIKYYCDARRFGWLTRGEGSADIFIMGRVLDQCGVTRPRVGDRLDVRFQQSDDQAPIAVEVAYPVGFVW